MEFTQGHSQKYVSQFLGRVTLNAASSMISCWFVDFALAVDLVVRAHRTPRAVRLLKILTVPLNVRIDETLEVLPCDYSAVVSAWPMGKSCSLWGFRLFCRAPITKK